MSTNTSPVDTSQRFVAVAHVTSLTSAEGWMTQTRIGLNDGDFIIHNDKAVSEYQVERQQRAQLSRNVDSLIKRLIDTGECRVKGNHRLTIQAELGSRFVKFLTRAECLEFLESHTRGKAQATFNSWRAALAILRADLHNDDFDTLQDAAVRGTRRWLIAPDLTSSILGATFY